MRKHSFLENKIGLLVAILAIVIVGPGATYRFSQSQRLQQGPPAIIE